MIPCPKCLGNGRMISESNYVPCRTCGGTGTIETPRIVLDLQEQLAQAREQIELLREDNVLIETQDSISSWAEETFGPSGSNLRVAIRANQEMAELLRELALNDSNPKAADEIADVIIVLCRLSTRLGFDIETQVHRKMTINRARKWKLDGSGHGYHVDPTPGEEGTKKDVV